MSPIKTTAHFIGGPWDGRTEQLDGVPPQWNVPLRPVPPPIGSDALAPDVGELRRVVYEPHEVWTWDGVRHARYVVAK